MAFPQGFFWNVNALQEIMDMAILAPTNDDSLQINNQVLDKAKHWAKEYISADQAICDSDEDASVYPLEFFNSITPSGMAPYKLFPKDGAIMMLLRNLYVSKGLCNGTRLIVKRTYDHDLNAEGPIFRNRSYFSSNLYFQLNLTTFGHYDKCQNQSFKYSVPQ